MSLLKGTVINAKPAGHSKESKMKLVYRFLITIIRNVLYRLRFIEV